jgi:hypothetical protein
MVPGPVNPNLYNAGIHRCLSPSDKNLGAAVCRGDRAEALALGSITLNSQLSGS